MRGYFYISDDNVSIYDVPNDDRVRGYIYFIVNEPQMTIMSFYCRDRGIGIGDVLLRHSIRYANDINIDEIVLDDMSDRYRQPHNIYTKHHFMYLDVSGPEMHLVPYRSNLQRSTFTVKTIILDME